MYVYENAMVSFHRGYIRVYIYVYIWGLYRSVCSQGGYRYTHTLLVGRFPISFFFMADARGRLRRIIVSIVG